jgi:hypothetical protein
MWLKNGRKFIEMKSKTEIIERLLEIKELRLQYKKEELALLNELDENSKIIKIR